MKVVKDKGKCHSRCPGLQLISTLKHQNVTYGVNLLSLSGEKLNNANLLLFL